MKIKEQLIEEIEASSEELLLETLDFLKFLKNQKKRKLESKKLEKSTGKSWLEHLETLGKWSGNDLEECCQMVRETRTLAKFDEFNPFDEE